MANEKRKTEVKLGPALGSYANIFEPRAVNEGDEPKYSISLIFKKDLDPKSQAGRSLAELRKMIEFVAEQKWGPKWKTMGLKLPIRDGDVDRPEHKEYANAVFLNASSKRMPGLVNRKLQTITDKEEAYSGCFFLAAVNVFTFEKKVNKGVALGLNNLLLWEKGERLDNRKSAEETFADVVEDEDSENPLD